jgi:hypothetical protein
MIRTLFERTKPSYIQCRNRRLLLRNREFESLEVTIRDLVPVRPEIPVPVIPMAWAGGGRPSRATRAGAC